MKVVPAFVKRAALRCVLLVVGAAVGVEAHKPVTSKYTYWDDVYPIVKEHCGHCHAPGGIAPMSLLTYESARPWAESIRLELTTGHMPPWFGDPGVAPLKDVHKLSPRDLDVVLTWVSGGTPAGQTKPIPESTVKGTWRRGRPDVTFALPAPVTLPANVNETTREIVLRGGNEKDQVIAAADLLPGNASIVHDALIYTTRPGDPTPNVIAAWVPGLTPVVPAAGAGFSWRAGESLVVRIHYKKTYKAENKAVSDRSTVGLYLVKGTARGVRSLALSVSGTVLDEDVSALAVRSGGGPSDLAVRVDAVRPDGSRLALGGFGIRAGWDQRYWLAQPATMAKGTRIAVTASGPVPTGLTLWLDVLESRVTNKP